MGRNQVHLTARVLHRQTGAMLGYAAGLLLLEWIIAALYPTFKGFDLKGLSEALPPAIQQFRGEGVGFGTFAGFLSTGFTHPATLLMLAAYPISMGTRAVVWEVSRGTADLLFSRPIGRVAVLAANIVATLVGLVVLSAALVAGAGLGMVSADMRGEVLPRHLLAVGINAFALGICIAGYAFLISARARDVGRANALAGGFTAAFFFLDFLAGLYEQVGVISPVAPFHYYKPGDILGGSAAWQGDVMVLVAAGVAGLILAAWSLNRRDL